MIVWLVALGMTYSGWIRFKFRKQPELMPAVGDHFFLLLAGTVLVAICREFIVLPMQIPSESMEPTITPGDIVLVDRITPAIAGLSYGDLLVFDDLEGNTVRLVKRIVGLPGDTIEYKNKELFVNGKKEPVSTSHSEGKLTQKVVDTEYGKQYQIQLDETLHRLDEGRWVVGRNEFFALGDNRDQSMDSRYFGMVGKDKIVGKAWMRIFSWRGGLSLPIPALEIY